jgi:hypothetical protein
MTEDYRKGFDDAIEKIIYYLDKEIETIEKGQHLFSEYKNMTRALANFKLLLQELFQMYAVENKPE